jgi:UDP-N-acetylmuramyl pentapeptide synthase
MDQLNFQFWQLARWHRQQLAGRVIVVAGGPGKSTTQQMIDVVLREQFSGRASCSDSNEPWALPLGLLELQRQDAYGVLEYRSSEKREIQSFSHLCQPEIGVINSLAQNVNPNADAGECGELELLAQLPEHGWAVLNGDEPQLCDWADRARSEIVLVGRGSHCDLTATEVRWSQGELRFVVEGAECQVRTWGRHALHAALAAYAVGRIFGLPGQVAAARLREFQPLPRRCQIVCQNRVTVIDDTYDGRYGSWPAALEVLRELETAGRRIVVCGDLADPEGGFRRQAEIGRAMIVQCGADWLIAAGPQGRLVVEAAQAAGMPGRRAVWRPRISEAAGYVQDLVQPGDVVLVKSGRDADLGQVVDNLLGRPLAAVA